MACIYIHIGCIAPEVCTLHGHPAAFAVLRRLYPSDAFISPEEQRNGARAGVAAYRRPDGVNFHLAIQCREAFLNQLCYLPGILKTGRLRNVAFAVIAASVPCVQLHLLNNGAYGLILAANLEARSQAPCGINIKQGADVQKRSEQAGSA